MDRRPRTCWSSANRPHACGLPVTSGGIGEFSGPTAIGIYESIRVTAEKVCGTADLAGRTCTVIGLGQVGYRLAVRVAADGAKLTVTDIDGSRQQFAHGIGAEWIDVDAALATRPTSSSPARSAAS